VIFLQYKPWKSNTKQRTALVLGVTKLKQPTAGTLFSLSQREKELMFEKAKVLSMLEDTGIA